MRRSKADIIVFLNYFSTLLFFERERERNLVFYVDVDANVCVQARRGWWIFWNCTYRQLWAT